MRIFWLIKLGIEFRNRSAGVIAIQAGINLIVSIAQLLYLDLTSKIKG